MGQYDYVTVATNATFKSELVDLLQLLCMLVLFAGMGYALIEWQHPADYYTDGTQ